MPWFSVYDPDTGMLHSTTRAVDLGVRSQGYAVQAEGDEEPRGAWNPVTLTYEEIVDPYNISVRDFMQRFTAVEWDGFKQSTDVNVAFLLDQLTGDDQIDLRSTETTDGLAYLVSVGLLEASRVPEILEENV